MTATVVFWSLLVLCLTGAIAVVFLRDVMRMALGLGGFLLGIAGFFALYGFGFLALAEIFVYVGGVLVLVLFAVMLVYRSEAGSPTLESRHDSLAAVACLGLFALLTTSLAPFGRSVATLPADTAAELARVLLGEMLPHFEAAGALLLAALVAVVAISGGERR